MYEIGLFDICKLPSDTHFYVNNGGWYGYIRDEDGMKVLFVGVSEESPLDDIKYERYVSRRSLAREELMSIAIISTQPSFCRELLAIKAPGKIPAHNKVNFLLGMISENTRCRDSDTRDAVEEWKSQILEIVFDLEDEIAHM